MALLASNKETIAAVIPRPLNTMHEIKTKRFFGEVHFYLLSLTYTKNGNVIAIKVAPVPPTNPKALITFGNTIAIKQRSTTKIKVTVRCSDGFVFLFIPINAKIYSLQVA